MDSSRSLSGFLSTLGTLAPEELLLVLQHAHRELDSRINPDDSSAVHLAGMGGWTACGQSIASYGSGCVGQVTCGICKKTDYYKHESGAWVDLDPPQGPG